MAVRSPARASGSTAAWVLAVLASIWFLRTARSLLIPIALAVLISYALEPIVDWLERHHIRRVFGASAVLVVIVSGIAAGGYMLRDDVRQFVQSAPEAAERAREKISAQLGVDGSLDMAAGALGGGSTTEAGGGQPTGTGQASGSLLQRLVGGVVAFAGHVVVVVFLVLFLLISGHHIRNRLVEIAGRAGEQRQTMAAIVDEINMQIQRYLLVLLLTGAIVGAATALVLLWLGTQHALMWGVLAGVFNAIPYFGPVVVSGGLLVVGLVQEGSLTAGLQMAGAAIVITSLEGWLLTPPLMGKVERMSALAVFLGLLVWTWIWGAWGTILAVPMLVVIKSVADHVERLRPVGRLMAP